VAAVLTGDWGSVARGDAPPVKFAAGELRKYIKQINGTGLQDQNAKRRIVLGRRDQLHEDERALLPSAVQGYDGYSVAVTDSQIIIAGDNELGVCYGVYDLLERIGCRWFYPQQDAKDREVVPATKMIELPNGQWSVASPFKFRVYNGDAFFFEVKKDPALAQIDHALKTRHNMIGWQQGTKESIEQQYEQMERDGILEQIRARGMTIHGPGHAFDRLLRWEDYGEKHAEWFGTRNGKRVPQNFFGAQFCWSNAEARKVFVDNVVRLADKMPLVHIFYIAPFDGGVACDCAECKAAGGASNLLMVVMGEVTERLTKTHPDTPVETVGGYGAVTTPPSEAKIHPKQRVVWAHWGRNLGYGYDDARYDKQNLEAWHQAARGGLTVCNYYSDNFAEPWVMSPWTIAIESDRRYLIAKKIDSVYFLIWPPGYWWNHSLNTYLAGRCFYDVSLDPRDLVRDYALHYYGPAGELMAGYFEQWAGDPDLAYRIKGNCTDRDRQTLADQRSKCIEPAKATVKGEDLYAYRASNVEGLHHLAERLAEGHRLRDQIRAARAAGDFDRASKLLAEADVYTDAIMGLFYDLADRNAGLMDRNEVPSFIKMGVKGWIAEESKAIEEHK
jgi:hypothetical protein